MKQVIFSLRLLLLIACLLACGCGGDNEDGSETGEIPYPDVPGGDGSLASAGSNFAFLQRRFSEAIASPTPWAGFWYPYSSNGISGSADKYEEASGNAGGAHSWEVSNHGQGLGAIDDWWGHCNGWAAASVLTSEPRRGIEVNGVDFDIGDRKALLSEVFMEVTGDFLGNRVNSPGDRSSAAFRDLSPAQFFLMLSNIMAAQGRTIVMDRYTGFQVWNHPVVAFVHDAVTSEDYLGPDPQFSNVHRVNMTTKVFWVSNNVSENFTTPAFDPNSPAEVFESRTLRYELWLDAAPQFDESGNLVSSGDVILTSEGVGGQWKNTHLAAENSHPDYMWIPTGAASSSGFKNPNIDTNWVLSNIR